MFLPTTSSEIAKLGWNSLDIILVTGDSYIDSPFIGVAVIGRVLQDAGYRVGIIAQPDIHSPDDITRLGEPQLFWGVTGGCVDSMVANYTALKKPRMNDDYTPGGRNTRRPDRAVIAYANLIRRYHKNTKPIVLGGIEASLRRIPHYDYWNDRIRKSILFDSKADFLLYGMAEKSTLELAAGLKSSGDVRRIRGLCYISKEPAKGSVELPSFEAVIASKESFIGMFRTFYQNNDALTAKTLSQRHGDRYLIQNPPSLPLTQPEMDALYALPYERAQHPYYQAHGSVKALETIRFSLSTHRGCYGECNFCAIAMHEGRTVQWRSQASIISEAELLSRLPDFKGYIHDVGGPTANMYGFECKKKLASGACDDKRCIYPDICPALHVNHSHQVKLLTDLRSIKGVKKIFVASGIRYDLVIGDRRHGEHYLEEVVEHHVSGQMKVAPEHIQPKVLASMGKPGSASLLEFKTRFEKLTREAGKPQFLTYYFIAAHPGCTDSDMVALNQFVSSQLHIHPEQVQIFTPTPSTWSSVMYYTGMDPFTGESLFVEKMPSGKQRQKSWLTR